MASLFDPITLGGGQIHLKHRVVLSPLTRLRADPATMTVQAMGVEYYKQRASDGGLLISEGTVISPEGVGGNTPPGIWTEDQVSAWRRVTDAVHEKGGYIFCQLWHQGRIGHPSYKAHPLIAASGGPWPSVSASAIAAPGKTISIFPKGKGLNATPRALETAEIPRLVEDYRHAARCAKKAGFDGVEIHSAHGYLLDQFIRTGTNQRTDGYGGTAENRCRLSLEVASAVIEEMGPGRVAVRLSPSKSGSMLFYGSTDSDELDEGGLHVAYKHLITELGHLPLAYLLLTEPRWHQGKFDDDAAKDPGFNMPLTASADYRPVYPGTLAAAGGFTPATAAQAVREGTCDLVGFGRWFISNPDLPERIREGAPLNQYNRKTFYSNDEEGYTDYPDMQGSFGVSGRYSVVSQNTLGVATAQSKL